MSTQQLAPETVHSKTPSAAPNLPRFWPAFALIVIYWIVHTISDTALAGTFPQFLLNFYTPIFLALGILIWWLGLSRQSWTDRLFGVGCLVVAGVAATLLAHRSMMMGMMMSALPVAITAIVITLAIANTLRLPRQSQWLALAAVSVLAWGYFTLIRLDGITGRLESERSWRWDPTAEDHFLAELKSQKLAVTPATTEMVATAADWPEFRGALRDGRLHNVTIATDWTANPPRKVWERRVGPGWSSFAVVGDRVFTQEQRGESEAVLCFDMATGQEIWSHEDKARFYDIVAGAGPRATPTFHGGKIYSLGGGGVLNCLDAATGRSVWKQDIAVDGNAKPPQWGFSSSPLVLSGVVTVFAGGKDDKSTLAYDAATGELKWSGGKGTHSYSSAQAANIAGQPQVLMMSDYGLESFEPTTGKLLWEHVWNVQGVFRVCQPHITADSKILIGTGMSIGTRLISVEHNGDEWKTKEEWTSKELKPYFNDFVELDGYLYGFDGEILVCLDLATGKKKWKKGRYGHGQALLVGDSGQMLVISEQGEAVLTEVTPQRLEERGKFKAVEGKTWNHPVIAGGKLLVRNGEQMACYEFSPPTGLASN